MIWTANHHDQHDHVLPKGILDDPKFSAKLFIHTPTWCSVHKSNHDEEEKDEDEDDDEKEEKGWERGIHLAINVWHFSL